MSIVIDNIEQFKVFFNVVYDISTELIELQLHTDRMVCAVLDRAKTRFFQVQYDIDFFKKYDVTEFRSLVVFMDDMYKLLKSTNNKDTLTLEANDPYLVARVESVNGNSRLFEFVLPSEDIDSPAPPHIDYPIEVEVDVEGLKQGAKDIGLIGSELFTFVIDKNKLTVMTDKNIPTKYANEMVIDAPDVSSAISSSFSLKYISQMLKFDKVNKRVTVKLNQDMPIIYTFEDEVMGLRVDGLIAPIISEDDEYE